MNQPKNIQTTTFSNRLGELIARNGITQKQLAAAVGISQGTISHYMRGTRTSPRADELLALAAYFGVTAEWLFGAGRSTSRELPSKELDARDSKLRGVIACLEEQVAQLRALTKAGARKRRIDDEQK